MIKGITGSSSVIVNGGSFSMPYINSSMPSAGMVRYKDNNLEVYDGNSWLTMYGGHVNIDLSPDVQSVINWAKTKMAEEACIRDLAAKHPTVADAIAAREHADEAVRIAAALCDTK